MLAPLVVALVALAPLHYTTTHHAHTLKGKEPRSNTHIHMAGQRALQKKQKILETVDQAMKPASLIFCARSEGIKVNSLNAFRQTLPQGVHMQCVKNTLIKIAAKDHEQFDASGLESLCHYSNYWFFVDEDSMRDGVKLWNDFIKDNKLDDNAIVGGVHGGEVLDAKGVVAVSKLPTKQELMGKTATLLKTLPAKIARTLKNADATRIARGIKEARGSKMARAVKAASEKLGS